VRIGEDLHRESIICSMKNGVNLNEFCRAAIAEKINVTKAA
jgi:predicted HicB family RNase H-like nuclease